MEKTEKGRAVLLNLTEEEAARLDALKAALGIRSGTDLVRYALVELARQRGIVVAKKSTEAA